MTTSRLAKTLMMSGVVLSLFSTGCATTMPVLPTTLLTATSGVTPSATMTLTATPVATTMASRTPSPTPAPTYTRTSRPTASPAPTHTPIPSIAAGQVTTLTIVYDNNVYSPGLDTDWGFACIIERGATTLLFDTGANGALLLRNMAALGYTPEAVDTVVLSHAHQDHTGGLTALLNTGAMPVVYVPSTFAPAFKQQVRARTTLIEVEGPDKILPGFTVTGPLGTRIPEQALAVETPAGLVIVTGCAHPGVVELTQSAMTHTRSDAATLVVGGFHLGNASVSEIETIIDALKALNVQRVAPCHCTGARAQQYFATAFGMDYLTAGVGWRLVLSEP